MRRQSGEGQLQHELSRARRPAARPLGFVQGLPEGADIQQEIARLRAKQTEDRADTLPCLYRALARHRRVPWCARAGRPIHPVPVHRDRWHEERV